MIGIQIFNPPEFEVAYCFEISSLPVMHYSILTTVIVGGRHLMGKSIRNPVVKIVVRCSPSTPA